jgi:prepilin-type N-terminal cleavage/methylation domain-containing protein
VLSRRGFSLVEIIVALVILAALAAALYPTVAGMLTGGQSAALAKQISSFTTAITNYQDNVGAYPPRLFLLNTQPVNGDDDSCGQNLSNNERQRWRGPYLTSMISGDVAVGTAIAKDTLIRVPPNNNALEAGILQLRFLSVDSVVASDIEREFDGSTLNYSTGNVLWTSTSPPEGTLTFQLGIRGC